MRIFLLIALLFAFIAGSFAGVAHASAENHTCAQHQIDNIDNTPCHSEQDQNHDESACDDCCCDESACDDCCCVHSHSMATSANPTKTTLAVSKQNIIASSDHYYSTEISSLKRPPRL